MVDKLEIGLSSASFYPDVNTENSIKLMKEIGFSSGELFLNTISEYEEDFIKVLCEERDKNNFNITSIHAFGSQFEPFLFDKYQRRSSDMLKIFKQVCIAARSLKAGCYTFHGMRRESFKFLDKKQVIDTYNELLYIASEQEIRLAQENVSWCISSEISFLKFLIENCKYPIHFTLDIKQAYKAGIELNDYIDTMGKGIVNFHINDRDSDNACLLPGTGEVDYKQIFLRLDRLNYNGPRTIEVYRNNYSEYNELLLSKEYLHQIYK